MNELFNGILTDVSADITPLSALITMLAALLFGGIISFTYKKTQDEALYQRSLAVTLFMLPVILSVIILFVGSNVARAFSLAGTLGKGTGNRPDFGHAELPDRARYLYERVTEKIREEGIVVKNGVFGAHMFIEQQQDGPLSFVFEC